jgi:hypothetical protein
MEARKKLHKIRWQTEKRKLSELVEYEHNPRQLTEKQHSDLKKSLEKFDLAEIPAINTDNKIIAGHQRLKILSEIYGQSHEIDVRVPSRKLTEKEFKEYNIRSNKNLGTWDFDILANSFDFDSLLEWGFDKNELDITSEKPKKDLEIKNLYEIAIECESENEQEKIYNELSGKYKCRILTL